MNRLGELWRRVLFVLRRSRLEDDMAEEIRLHLELRAAQQEANGGAPAAAASYARRRFGNVTRLREQGREVWIWTWLESLAQDIRYGARALAVSPGFTLTAIVSLALGIGANTAIFTIINAVMLRSLPVEDPQRLVEIRTEGFGSFTNPLWEQIRDHQRSFSGAFAFGSDRFDLSDGGESHFADALWVSGDFFRVLGVPPLRGRVFKNEDDRHGGGVNGPVAVISYSFWQSHFGGDPGVVGRSIRLARRQFEIVGVTPPWFTGLDVDRGYEVAIPIGCEPIIHTDQSALEQRSWWWLRIVGRLGPGTGMKQAEAEIKVLAPEIYRATVPQNWERGDQDRYLRRTFSLHQAATGFSNAGGRYRKALFTLMAVVGLVLLIACANIANLLLARGAARAREISIRLAIGAGRARVIRQLLTESLMVSLLGAAAGLLLAQWGSKVLVGMLSSAREPLALDLAPDLHVLGFATGLAVLTAVLFGLVPAFRATRVGPNQVLKESARGASSGSARSSVGKALVAGQVALSLVLLIAAGLFLGTMHNLVVEPAGFNPRNVLLARADTQAKIPKAARNGVYATLLERLRRVPGVTSVSASSFTPISNVMWDEFAYPDGYRAKAREDLDTFFNRVSPGYFRTLGTALLMGRDFSDSDTAASPKVIIINERAARQFFKGASPLGRSIGLDVMGKPGEMDKYEVIGVVRNTKYMELREEPRRIAYLAMAQDPDPWPQATFELRTVGDPAAVSAAVRSAVAEVNPRISLEFRSFETQVKDSLAEGRLVALLSAFFGGLALVLAMIGLYGVTAYGVARRQGEIGIRMALGARPRTVVGLVLGDVANMLGIGTVLGLAAALAAGRLVDSLLYGVRPTDVRTFGLAALILAVTAALAGYLPARRASHLDPARCLRQE